MFGACHNCKGYPLNRDGKVVSFVVFRFHVFIFFYCVFLLSRSFLFLSFISVFHFDLCMF